MSCVKTTWRGVTVCAHTVPKLDAWAASVGSGVRISPIPGFGSYETNVASGGTGAGGGHLDANATGFDSATCYMVEAKGREHLLLTYHRTAIPNYWEEHWHTLDPACPSLSTAAEDQFPRFQQGLDNLADNGPDTGDRTYVSQIMAQFNNRFTSTGTAYGVLPSAFSGADMNLTDPIGGGYTVQDALNRVMGGIPATALNGLSDKLDAVDKAVSDLAAQEAGRYSSNYETDKDRYSALQTTLDALKAEVAALPKA